MRVTKVVLVVGGMPGALKARETDGGSTIEAARVVVERKVVAAGKVMSEVHISNRGENGESSKDKKKRRKKKRKLNSPSVEKGRDFDKPLDWVCLLFNCVSV